MKVKENLARQVCILFIFDSQLSMNLNLGKMHGRVGVALPPPHINMLLQEIYSLLMWKEQSLKEMYAIFVIVIIGDEMS